MKKGKKLFCVLALCVGAAVTYPVWLPLPGRFLTVKDSAAKADAVVVLSGDGEFRREAKAVALYKGGFTPRIIRVMEKVDPPWFATVRTFWNIEISQSDLYHRYFESCGVPADALIFGDRVATSTFDELRAAKGILRRLDVRSIILVTADYHMRRSLMTAQWVLGREGIRIYTASAYSGFHPRRWWGYENDVRAVFFEYLDMAFYLVHHFLLNQ